MRRRGSLACWVLAGPLFSCQSLEKFDTKNGAAYCGSIVQAQFVRTKESEGGFDRSLRLRLEIDTDHLTTTPGRLTTDDSKDGPCAPNATFDRTPLRVPPEVVHDTLSTMTFEDGQVQNLVAWVDSSCRGSMLAIVSLLKNDRIDVRLLKPAASGPHEKDAFALFPLDRSESGCGF